MNTIKTGPAPGFAHGVAFHIIAPNGQAIAILPTYRACSEWLIRHGPMHDVTACHLQGMPIWGHRYIRQPERYTAPQIAEHLETQSAALRRAQVPQACGERAQQINATTWHTYP